MKEYQFTFEVYIKATRNKLNNFVTLGYGKGVVEVFNFVTKELREEKPDFDFYLLDTKLIS